MEFVEELGKRMGKVKTRKQGNSIVVSLKKELKVDDKQEFYVYQDDSGYITLVPKIPDYYATASNEELQNMDPDNLAKNINITENDLNDD